LHVISQFVDPGVQDVTANWVLKGRLLPLSAHEIAEEAEDDGDEGVGAAGDEGAAGVGAAGEEGVAGEGGVALAHAMSEMSVYMLG